MCSLGWGKFGCICLEWFARGQGIWLQIFEKSQIPTPCPASPPPAGITLIGALCKPSTSSRVCLSRILPTPPVFKSGYANTENVFYCLTMGSWQILKGVLEGLPRSPSLCVFLVAQSGTVMIAQRESRQRAHRHGGDVIFAGKSALKCVLANVLTDLTVSFVPVAKQWRAIQMVNRVTSQIIQ